MLPNTPPSCGVVIYKDNESENVCPEIAVSAWPFQFVESIETGMLYFCQRHTELFQQGHELIVVDQDGNHLSVQLGESYVTPQSRPDEDEPDAGRTPFPELDEARSDGSS